MAQVIKSTCSSRGGSSPHTHPRELTTPALGFLSTCTDMHMPKYTTHPHTLKDNENKSSMFTRIPCVVVVGMRWGKLEVGGQLLGDGSQELKLSSSGLAANTLTPKAILLA